MDTEHNKTCYRVGWITGMKAIQNGIQNNIKSDKIKDVEWFYRGYYNAFQHFAGRNSKLAAYAYTMGLVETYKGFYGQSDWVHPNL